MGKLRLTPLIVAAIGVVACVLVVVLLVLLAIKPAHDALVKATTRYDAAKQYEDPSLIRTAKADKEKAESDLANAKREWNYLLETKNPLIDMTDRFVAWKQYCREMEIVLGPMIDKFIQTHPKTAVVLGQTSLDAPSPDPNKIAGAIIEIPVHQIPWPAPITAGGAGSQPASGGGSNGSSGGTGGGALGLVGSFDECMQQIAAWNKFNRIVLIDDVHLGGYSPVLQMNYNATIYEWTKNSEKPGVSLPSNAGAVTK